MENNKNQFHVGIIGGGVGGSTAALRFAELGVKVTLFERGPSLVNGPPICHLHAGGNLYREISESQCLTLLRECIDTLRVFPHTINYRPTMISVPKYDDGDPMDILPRLQTLKEAYRQLVDADIRNRVLGDPEDYFKIYNHEDIVKLRHLSEPTDPKSFDEWMIPVSKKLELDGLKFPIIMVEEYGWSVLRMSAALTLALQKLPNCTIMTNTEVSNIEKVETNNGWSVYCKQMDDSKEMIKQSEVKIDYLVNACGYKTGTIDNFVKVNEDRMVEFKAAYVTKWNGDDENINSNLWPEIIVHGTRGTPNGMMQLTPNPDNIFQLHGMTEDITLFSGGLAKTSAESSQPELGEKFETKLEHGWSQVETCSRTKRAIEHTAKFFPTFSSASVAGPPLFGAQQIPGKDPSLRAASVGFPTERYARVEIVKGSSALGAADAIVDKMVDTGFLNIGHKKLNVPREESFRTILSIELDEVVKKAEEIAQNRDWPLGLARPVGNISGTSRKSLELETCIDSVHHNVAKPGNFQSIQTNSAVLNILKSLYYYIYNIPRTLIPLFLRSTS